MAEIAANTNVHGGAAADQRVKRMIASDEAETARPIERSAGPGVQPDFAAHHGHGEPSPWVSMYLGGVDAGGAVLDVACGSGRHLRLALSHGHTAVGVDRTLDGVADLVSRDGVTLIEADLENGRPWPLASRRFAGVIVTNYLWRPILPDIIGAVARDGLLIYETFAQGHERFGRPSNPDFLLAPGELLDSVRGHLVPIAYECVTLTASKRVVQRMAAVARDHRWLIDPPASFISRNSDAANRDTSCS